jgi:hypothetical protein
MEQKINYDELIFAVGKSGIDFETGEVILED